MIRPTLRFATKAVRKFFQRAVKTYKINIILTGKQLRGDIASYLAWCESLLKAIRGKLAGFSLAEYSSVKTSCIVADSSLLLTEAEAYLGLLLGSSFVTNLAKRENLPPKPLLSAEKPTSLNAESENKFAV